MGGCNGGGGNGAPDCTGPAPPLGGFGFAPGDPEIAIAYPSTNGGIVTLAVSSGYIPVVPAPQGGMIVLAGVRARNLDPCITTLTAAIRDPLDGNRIIALEQRPNQLAVVGTSGWLEPTQPEQLYNWANLPACPGSWTRDLHGEAYVFELTATDRRGAQATASMTLVPRCAYDMQYCVDTCTLAP